MEMEENQWNALFLEVFTNQVITHHLESFLDIQTMKAMRGVSRLFNEIVLSYKTFGDQSTITLYKSRLLDAAFRHLSFQPGHLNIYPFIIKKRGNHGRVTKQVCKLAQGCRSLTIWDLDHPNSRDRELIPSWKVFPLPHTEPIKIPRHCPCAWYVIVAARSITKLSLPNNAVFFLNQQLLREDQKDFRLPANLKDFRINTNEERAYDVIALENVIGLERIWHNDPHSYRTGGLSRFKHLISLHRNSLVQLSLLTDSLWLRSQHEPLVEYEEDASPEHFGLHFPNLRSLSTRLGELIDDYSGNYQYKWGGLRMSNFIGDHIHQLENLSLAFAIEIQRYALGIPWAYGNNLKSLKIAYIDADDGYNHWLPLQKWMKCIQELPLLEELELGLNPERSFHWRIDDSDFDLFSYFPSSLRSFKLYGYLEMRRGSEFLVTNPDSLQRLTNLVSLKIEGKAFGDDIFRGICTYLISLKSLDVHHCTITDAAFLGTDLRQSGEPVLDPPLAKLKNLKYLRLIENYYISPDVLLGVKFDQLDEICIDFYFKFQVAAISEEIFKTLLLNNPALKTAEINCKTRRRPAV